MMDVSFLIHNLLLGAGLAADAFSVSCANALREPGMRLPRMSMIAGVYGIFQFLMPLAGWLCVHTIKEHFTLLQPWIPRIAFVLLAWIGGKMLVSGIRDLAEDRPSAPSESAAQGETCPAHTEEEGRPSAPSGSVHTGAKILPFSMLLVQGVATSIDALSVGFTIAGYSLQSAFISCLIIGAVTYVICMGGLAIGKRAGMKLTGKADLIGGAILIAIGILNVIG